MKSKSFKSKNALSKLPQKKKRSLVSKSKKKSNQKTSKIDYKKSGVDVDAGDALVDWLAEDSQAMPHQNQIVDGIGGFASLFRVDFSQYQEPCLVTCTDGVGTKVKLASHFGDYSGVGQDLVAMCANDLICTGGDPLLFLDYYATGKLDLRAAKEFLQSVKRACRESEMALVGGETAEMPGVYQKNDFDCAGFAVGVVDRKKSLGRHLVMDQDVVVGVSSSGFHSNGYSLIRKIFQKDLNKFKTQLLQPTALYVKLAKELKDQVEVHAFAHITGGGIENIPRVIPEHLYWEMKTWKWPSLFKEVQRRTGLTDIEMMKTLNCGVGFVVILPQSQLLKAQKIIQKHQFQFFDLGRIRK